jgi:hypothetical protein
MLCGCSGLEVLFLGETLFAKVKIKTIDTSRQSINDRICRIILIISTLL